MLRRSISLLALAGLAASGGCKALTDASSSGTPVAVVVLNARTKGTGYTTSPVVNFYRAQNITFSSAAAATDSCVVTAYDPNAASGATATVIGGGAAVVARVSGTTDSLRQSTTADATYRSRLTSGIPFTPGDSIYLTIPGDAAGFPPMTATSRTAEAFTVDPIVVPPAGQNMAVSWTAASDANAAMLFYFRYSDGTSAGLNTQIFCDFRDDGTGTVQATNIVRWAAGSPRDVLVQRLRTTLLQSGTGSGYLNVISTFEKPTPVSP